MKLAEARAIIHRHKVAAASFKHEYRTPDQYGGRGMFQQNKRVQTTKMIDQTVQGGPNSSMLGRFGRGMLVKPWMETYRDTGESYNYGKSRWAGGEKVEGLKGYGGAALSLGGQAVNTAFTASMLTGVPGLIGGAAKGVGRFALRQGFKAMGGGVAKGVGEGAIRGAAGEAAQVGARTFYQPSKLMAGRLSSAESSAAKTFKPDLKRVFTRRGAGEAARFPPQSTESIQAQSKGFLDSLKGFRPADPASANLGKATSWAPQTTGGPGQLSLLRKNFLAAAKNRSKQKALQSERNANKWINRAGLTNFAVSGATKNVLGSGTQSLSWKQNDLTSMGDGVVNPYLRKLPGGYPVQQ